MIHSDSIYHKKWIVNHKDNKGYLIIVCLKIVYSCLYNYFHVFLRIFMDLLLKKRLNKLLFKCLEPLFICFSCFVLFRLANNGIFRRRHHFNIFFCFFVLSNYDETDLAKSNSIRKAFEKGSCDYSCEHDNY